MIDNEELIEKYRAYLAEHPADAGIWFDLGLSYKRLRRWEECIEANERALALSSKKGDPAWWNLGIAATAVRDWKRARKAWRGYGIKIPKGDGPPDLQYGIGPVRLPNNEVVWGDRLDPARFKLQNIPFPESGFRWGDIVLNDGEPNGERRSNGRTYPVFDVLERLIESEIPTLTTDIEGDDDDARALIDLFDSNHFAAEDWTKNVRMLCAACSRGNPDAGAHRHTVEHADQRMLGIACTLPLAKRLLETWKSEAPERRSFGEIVESD